MHVCAGGMGDMTNDDMGAISMDVMGGMQHAEEHVDVVSENHGPSGGTRCLSSPGRIEVTSLCDGADVRHSVRPSTDTQERDRWLDEFDRGLSLDFYTNHH